MKRALPALCSNCISMKRALPALCFTRFMTVTGTGVLSYFSGEGSQYSGNSDERNLAVMARAVLVHPDTLKVMYFA